MQDMLEYDEKIVKIMCKTIQFTAIGRIERKIDLKEGTHTNWFQLSSW